MSPVPSNLEKFHVQTTNAISRWFGFRIYNGQIYISNIILRRRVAESDTCRVLTMGLVSYFPVSMEWTENKLQVSSSLQKLNKCKFNNIAKSKIYPENFKKYTRTLLTRYTCFYITRCCCPIGSLDTRCRTRQLVIFNIELIKCSIAITTWYVSRYWVVRKPHVTTRDAITVLCRTAIHITNRWR